METYTIKAGDNLAAIAVKLYGDANKWREIADLNGIADPSKIKAGQVLNLLPKKAATTGVEDAEITIEGKKAFYRFKDSTDKIFLGDLWKKGLSRIGSFNTERFIADNATLLSGLKLSKSEINTLLATSHNEGNLDSINTWDSMYLSWGMFQWTLGSMSDQGELPALLKVIKDKQPAAFKNYFSDFGIDIAPVTGSITGYLMLNQVIQNTDTKKTTFRNNNWALRFALAGKNPAICAAQVLHAINRFNRFYFVPDPVFGGRTINELLSSEYAASLLIDQHVNRPGHVKEAVASALKQAGITAAQLASGSDTDELKVINKYLVIRRTFGNSPMTNSDTRAKVVKNFLDKGLISAKKRSFISNRALRR